MSELLNKLGQPIGETISGGLHAQFPEYSTLEGRLCRVEPVLAVQHGNDLFEAYAADEDNKMWTYMSYGPFRAVDDLYRWLEKAKKSADPQFYALIDKANNKAVGLASYMRIKPEHGVVEVGGISFSPSLRRTATATEAMFLMMERVFDLGYRRYEWKCDALNHASRSAAQRLGFQYEGIFKKHMIYHGRNRDTAWYSILDDDWEQLKKAYLQWLAPENFNQEGQQIKKLANCIINVRASEDLCSSI